MALPYENFGTLPVTMPNLGLCFLTQQNWLYQLTGQSDSKMYKDHGSKITKLKGVYQFFKINVYLVTQELLHSPFVREGSYYSLASSYY